jgi:hypothetical protein
MWVKGRHLCLRHPIDAGSRVQALNDRLENSIETAMSPDPLILTQLLCLSFLNNLDRRSSLILYLRGFAILICHPLRQLVDQHINVIAGLWVVPTLFICSK